jgi:phytoene desaturase
MARIAVVGAGLAGLSAATRLAAEHHEVIVFDRRPGPGGRAAARQSEGFVLDHGPVVLTMVSILERVFTNAGAQLEDYLELLPVEPSYRLAFADGRDPEGAGVLLTWSNPERMAEEIRSFAGARGVDEWRRWVRWLEELAAVELPGFIEADVSRLPNLLARTDALVRLWRLGAFRRLESLASTVISDPRLRRAVTFQALYAGVSPQRALGLFGIIAYMDVVLGVVWPRGGMVELGAALARLAKDRGAELHLAEPVLDYERVGRRLSAVVSVQERYPVDAVVSTEDVLGLGRRLGLAYARRRWRLAPSALLLVRAEHAPTPEGLAHHNLFLGRSWAGAFHDLIDEETLMRDPSILVTLPQRTDPSVAPEGSRVVYALEPAPNQLGRVPWESAAPLAFDRLERHLAQVGLGRTNDVVDEVRLDPPAWEALGMDGGTPFALAHTFFQSGPFRAPIQPRELDNLVLAGSGTHPGVGVPLVLISGQLAAERVLRLVGHGGRHDG